MGPIRALSGRVGKLKLFRAIITYIALKETFSSPSVLDEQDGSRGASMNIAIVFVQV